MGRGLSDALREVRERLAQGPHLLLCMDFDGTLTPLVDDPAQATLSPDTRRVLLSLAAREGISLVLISGRSRADLQALVGIPGLIYAGNHGLEISGTGFIFVEPTAARCSKALKELAADLARKLQHIPGTSVEDKGLTLSVHYRQAAATDREEVQAIAHAATANTKHNFRLTRGNQVLEIRPRVPWDKGIAVRWIREQLGKPKALTIYLGDDVTDEDAFVALPEAITIKVGRTSETAAQYQLEGPAVVHRFLELVEPHLSRKAICVAATEGTGTGGEEA
jgi:trehalose 6-phosphate phosphatase